MKKKGGHRKNTKHHNINEKKVIRILLLTTAVLYPLIIFVLPHNRDDVFDPIEYRLIISIISIGIFVVTYINDFVKKNINSIFIFLYVFIVLHHFVLLYLNHVSTEYTLYLLIVLSAMSTVFKQLKSMLIVFLIVASITIFIAFMVQDPELDFRIFIGVIFSILIISLVVVITNINLNEQLVFSNTVVNELEALVFVVDRQGNCTYVNESVNKILGYKPAELIGTNWIMKLGIEKEEARKMKNSFILISIGTIPPERKDFQMFVSKSGQKKWFSIQEKIMGNNQVLVVCMDVTHQKKIQDKLAFSERNFRQINESLTDVFYLYNIKDEKYEYISPNCKDVVGVSEEYFYTSKRSYIDDFIVEEYRDNVRSVFCKVDEGIPFDIEYTIFVDNKIRWIREKTHPVKDEFGNIIKKAGICQDITERKMAKNEIEKLSLIASNTDNFIIIVGIDNKVEWANEAFYKLTGYNERHVINEYPLSLISGPLTEYNVIEEINKSLFIDKKQLQCELINYKRNGNIFYSNLEFTPVLNTEGDLKKYFVIGTDITQRVEDQEQINKLSMVASNTSNYVIIAHADDGIEWVNDSFVKLFGYTLDEVKGKYPSEFLHSAKTQPEVVKAINKTVFEKGQKFTGEIIHLTKDGELIFANVDITPFLDKDGVIEKYFVLGVDISERKQYEEQIEKTNRALLIKEKALFESEQNFRELIRSIRQVFWLSDYKKKELIFVSSSYQNVFGKPAETLMNDSKSWLDNIHIEDKERVIQKFKEHAEFGTFNEDFRLVLEKDRIKWINSKIFLIRNEKGEIEKMSGFFEDITFKKEQEISLSKIADKLDILHSIENAILTSESTEEIIYNALNKSLFKLPIKRASLTLFNYKDKTFYAYAKMWNDKESTANKKIFDLEEFSVLSILEKQKSYHVEDITKRENISKADQLVINEGVKLVLFSPLFHGDELIGSFNVCFKDDVTIKTEHYIEVTNEVAKGLAIAINQSQLKDQVHQSNLEIKSSIDYAKMIQQAYIPSRLEIDSYFLNNFIINRPKDIVSGDFYWVGNNKDTKVIAVGDCTGHGVPGAFMTIIGISELNTIVNQNGIVDPAEILNELNIAIKKALRTTSKEIQLKDGMDIGILSYNTKTNTTLYGGARRPLYQLTEKKLKRIDGAKLSIGDQNKYLDIQFETIEIELHENDQFYIFSDGCTDQFGGEKTKKFSRRRLESIILENSDKSFAEQKALLNNTLKNWQGDYYQTDDILFVGFSIK